MIYRCYGRGTSFRSSIGDRNELATAVIRVPTLGAAAGGLLLDHQLTPDRLPLVGAALGVLALTAHLLTMRREASPA